MATDFSNLIPVGVSSELIESVGEQSIVLTFGRRVPMPEGVERVPVVSTVPTADFVGVAGRKPVSKVEWTSEQLEAEELAVICYFPQAFLDDAGYPVWDSVRDELAKAIGRRLDEAVLFGVNPPASYPANGLIGAGAPLSGTSAFDALDKGFAAVEADGLEVTGIAAGASIRSALRKEWQTAAALPSQSPDLSYWGVPIETTPVWEASKGDAIVGDWNLLLVGIRQDIRFETSTDAILQDGAGAIIANAFQEDLVAMRVYMRIGIAAGNPVKPDGTVADATFVAVDWTA